MTRAIEALRALSALLPLILQLVRELEQAIPDTGRGGEKLAQIREILQRVFATLTGLTVTFDQIWPTVQALIAGIVAAFNATGVFRKPVDPKA